MILGRESPNDITGSLMTSSLGSPLISLALVSTYKSIHVNKNAKKYDFFVLWHLGYMYEWSVLKDKSQMMEQCECNPCHCTSLIKIKIYYEKLYYMDVFSTIGLGCTKHIHWEVQMVKITKEMLQHSGIMGKLHLPSILCHCKYRMKEYTMKIHLYFNMYFII